MSSALLLFLTLTILLAGAITLVLAILSFVRGDSAVTSIALLFGSCIVFGFVGILLYARQQLTRRGDRSE